MSEEAWDKIIQTHNLFKKIVAPLKQHLGINFGYMIVFNDGRYYQIIEDLKCLEKWVTNVETSHIFCARNVTTYFDEPYNFTIWPEEPNCLAMEIYKEHGMWNGITASKPNKDYTELYWFTKQNAEVGWHKWFIRNKLSLYKFIKHFDKYKRLLFLQGNDFKYELFRFKQEFKISTLQSEYVKEELSSITMLITSLALEHRSINPLHKQLNLSTRELEVLSIICCGYSYKITAQKLGISPKTVHYHLDRIKARFDIHSKSELIEFFENQCFSEPS